MRVQLERPGTAVAVLCSALLALAGPIAFALPEEPEGSTQQVPFSRASIARGKVLFGYHCTECHGRDGKALIDIIADATDLTSPELWYNGTAREEVFASIRTGAGVNMPPYEGTLNHEQIWDLVNFTQSLWPVAKRPELQRDVAEELVPQGPQKEQKP